MSELRAVGKNAENIMTETPRLIPQRKVSAKRFGPRTERCDLSWNAKALLIRSTPIHWLRYLTGIKHSLGNVNNDIGFVATLLARAYLNRRFGITDFDAAGKPQGASGIDIAALTADGKIVVGELKTTKPYQPGFGAAQRTSVLKDLARLATTTADHRFMFVVDPDAYRALGRRNFASKAPGVEVVDLVTGENFTCV
jgi:hypothetical protein